ncbi:hypothetical protein HN51_029599 [Arachis hypogaea]
MAQSGAFTSSTTIDMLDPHGAYKRHVCMAATLGDWGKASSYDETQPNWVSTTLTRDGDTALHIAVSMEHIGFVEKLVERMSMQDLEIMDADGNTAFSMAAISGNVKLATILLGKNSGLLWLRGHKGMLPIQLAFSAGQPHMVNFLFEKTQSDDMDTHLSYQDIVNLFFLSLTYNNFTVASMLLKRYPEFAGVKNEKGLTAFEVLAQQTFDKDAPDYQHILNSLFKHMVEEDDFPNSERMPKAMFDAAKSGNLLILEFILKHNPKLLMKKKWRGENLTSPCYFISASICVPTNIEQGCIQECYCA